MMAYNQKNNIYFKTSYKIEENSVDRIGIHVKYPNSDFRQKIRLIESNPEPKKREFVSRGSYNLYFYEFGGDVDEAEIVTRFNAELVPKTFPVSNSPFPPINEKDFLEYYLQATPMVQSDDPEIIEMSENLTALTKRLPMAVSRIIRYIKNYIKADLEYMNVRASALDVLKEKKGCCDDINHLFNAFCRAANIPTRIAMGISKSEGDWNRHVWSEIYDPQFGWYPVDILAKSPNLGYVDVSYLKIMTSLDCNEPEIRVDYDYPTGNDAPRIQMKHVLFIDRSAITVQFSINQQN